MGTLLQDLKYGLRMLAKNPGFTTVAILTLALGIGANTAIFSVVNGVLLRPLPYEQPGQLVNLWEEFGDGGRNAVAGGVFTDWKEHSTVFEALSVISGSAMNLTGAGEPERTNGLQVSASFLEILRVHPVLGRGFLPDEDRLGKDNRVIIFSHRFWQRRFGGRANLVGRTIRMDGERYTVIGILPPRALLSESVDYLVPFVFGNEEWQRSRGDQRFEVIARLKSRVTIEQARTELRTIKQRLQSLYPKWKEHWSAIITPMHEDATAPVKPTLLVLMGAVGFVLLIACANVANLLLAKAATRQKEMSIRLALGASRGHVIRQVLTESILLALIGGALGVMFAFWGVEVLSKLSEATLPLAREVTVDARVLFFSLVASVGVGIAFGLVPALQVSAADLNSTLKEGGRGSMNDSVSRVRSSLIVSEVALALVLLVGAGLLLKSFFHLLNVAPGFNPDNVLTMELSLPEVKYPTGDSRARFLHQVFQRLEAIPGVDAAGMATSLPMMGWSLGSPVSVEGRVSQPEFGYNSAYDFISGTYFRAMGIPLLKGRVFTEYDDSTKATRVVIFDQALAKKVFPDEDPLGKRIRFWGDLWEVVGVVGSVRHQGLDGPAYERIYLPQAFGPWSGSLVVRTKVPPLGLVEPTRKEILAVDPEQPVSNISTMSQMIADSVAQRRLTLILLSMFASAAVLLAAIGLYGVMAYAVVQRTHEIGVRMALGAQRRDVVKLVVRGGLQLTSLGVLFGLAGSLAVTRVLASQLFEVRTTDASAFLGASFLLVLVAVAACYIPARRATKVDPMTALRCE